MGAGGIPPALAIAGACSGHGRAGLRPHDVPQTVTSAPALPQADSITPYQAGFCHLRTVRAEGPSHPCPPCTRYGPCQSADKTSCTGAACATGGETPHRRDVGERGWRIPSAAVAGCLPNFFQAAGRPRSRNWSPGGCPPFGLASWCCRRLRARARARPAGTKPSPGVSLVVGEMTHERLLTGKSATPCLVGCHAERNRPRLNFR
jgi:hypothetical protein